MSKIGMSKRIGRFSYVASLEFHMSMRSKNCFTLIQNHLFQVTQIKSFDFYHFSLNQIVSILMGFCKFPFFHICKVKVLIFLSLCFLQGLM